jgi:microcin C transport system substrate-binding protein
MPWIMTARSNRTPVRVRALASFLATILLVALSAGLAGAQAAEPKPAHGIAMHGDLKYPPGFKHFDYVNPNAPKGGLVKLAGIGTFDSLNPFILRGVAAAASLQTFDTLLASAEDEPFSEYGLVAESLEVPDDRSWVIFNLRPEARFHDGSPITADDVVFSLEILKAKGHPQLRFYYSAVAKAEALGPRRVKFTFAPGENREMPLIIGQMPIFSKAYWQGRDFEKTTLEPPLGSGPYKVETVDPGRSITLKRVDDYWGAKIPVNVGRFNFDRIRTDYYRDATVALEAFKAGQYDFRLENSAKNWATGYDVPALRQGLIVKEEIPNSRPTGMQAYAFNLRRPIFADPRVREALSYAFDFEWTNRTLFYGAYTRTESYFSNSELASRGLPEGEELDILNKFRDKLPPEAFTESYEAPKTDGSGNIRPNLLKALDLLKQAGWHVDKDRLVNEAGEPMRFEVLLFDPGFERVTLPFARNLKRIGIEATVRTVDASQYQNRMDHRDFDMIVMSWGESLSPGNEQRDFWSSAAADTAGSRNVGGIKSPVVDALVDLVVAAPDRDSLVARTRALDRALLWGHYVIPQWHLTVDRVASWAKLSRPKVTPTRGVQFDAWWIDPKKEQTLAERMPEVPIQAPPLNAQSTGETAQGAEAPGEASPTTAGKADADSRPNPFSEWWRWAMVAAILALAIYRWQRRRRR